MSTIPSPIANKVAVVTGGSRGIGAAIAYELVRLGSTKIAITYYTNKDAADKVVARITDQFPHAQAKAIKADLLDLDYGPNLIKAVCEELATSTVDIVVNNAVVVDFQVYQPFEAATLEGFQKVMLGNVWAPLQLIRAALPIINRGGRIINISSATSLQASPDPLISYGMSKAALDNSTRSLATKYAADKGITINSVLPGPIETDALAAVMEKNEDLKKGISEMATAEKRIGQPDDVAEIVGFLAGPGSRWLNGNLIPAAGGRI